MRGAFRTIVLALLLFVVALAQGSVIARMSWPGPGEPQLAALAVLTVALRAGARAGAIAGFGVGLLLDLLPPATHATGQWAFALCLLGYLIGLLASDVAGSTLLAGAFAAVGAALAPLTFTLLGQVLGDPHAGVLDALQRLPAVALSTLLLTLLFLPLLRRRRERPIAVEVLAARAPLVLR